MQLRSPLEEMQFTEDVSCFNDERGDCCCFYHRACGLTSALALRCMQGAASGSVTLISLNGLRSLEVVA
jgi:hypothetical protein